MIDGFAWLHRGAFSCALELATGQVLGLQCERSRVRAVRSLRVFVHTAIALTGPLPGHHTTPRLLLEHGSYAQALWRHPDRGA